MKQFFRPAVFLTLVNCMLVAAACSSDTAEQEPPAPLVEIKDIKAADVDWEPEFIGQTAGFLEVEIRARVGGILEQRLFQEGQFVEKGTQLSQIDPVPYEIELERSRGVLAQAEAQLERTRREHVRITGLFKDSAVSERERDEAEMAFAAAQADLQVARANVRDAEVRLSYTRVYAPISGMMRKEACSVGTLVETTTDASLLTTMVQVDPLYVNFSAPGSDFNLMRRLRQLGILLWPEGKLEAVVIRADGTQHPHAGLIVYTDSSEDPNTATVRSKVELPNPGAALMPGQFVRVKPRGMKLLDAILVPKQAIFVSQQGPAVYVVDENMQVHLRPVTEELSVGSQRLISAGLADGERIITAGLMKVLPGQTVLAAAPVDAQPNPTADE
jgi:membrane fusion protein, multidrug efflux system